MNVILSEVFAQAEILSGIVKIEGRFYIFKGSRCLGNPDNVYKHDWEVKVNGFYVEVPEKDIIKFPG